MLSVENFVASSLGKRKTTLNDHIAKIFVFLTSSYKALVLVSIKKIRQTLMTVFDRVSIHQEES